MVSCICETGQILFGVKSGLLETVGLTKDFNLPQDRRRLKVIPFWGPQMMTNEEGFDCPLDPSFCKVDEG